jgi:two-component system chemotaxis sensor kinase CheA
MDKRDEEFLKRLLSTFKIEAQEHLSVITSGLIEIEKGEGGKQAEIIETVYRESHSLKGAARSVDLNRIVAVCQSMEDVFSAMKRKEIVPSSRALDLLHKAVDFTGKLVPGKEFSAPAESEIRELIRELQSICHLQTTGAEDEGPGATGRGPGIEHKETLSSIRPEIQPSPAPAAARAETIRISAAKLDTLLLHAEEMLSGKFAAGQRAADLRGLKKIFDLWKNTRGKNRPMGRDRRRDKDDNESFMKAFEGTLTKIVKAAELDHRSLGAMVDTMLDDMKRTMMLPFSSILDVLPGVVRNLSREAGKEVELAVRGEEIEIDRRVMEEIKDPLTHLIRNCIDHGIEAPHYRKEKEKTPRGNIGITISSRDNNIEVAISDDGSGIDASRVKSAAVRNGFISQEEADRLSDREALLLAFRSGITTSRIITDISGRGLGLAIVREKVEKLNGTIEIDSQQDIGTTIKMLVPLTLATFRGVLVRVAEHLFVLPSTNVQRVERVKKEEIRTIENRETVSFDGQPVALVRLGNVLELQGGPSQTGGPFVLVVVLGSAEKRMAFVTDEVLHEQEVLVKPLGKQLARVRNISGATILSSGEIVPVLNVSDLMQSAVKAAPVFAGPVAEVSEKRRAVLVVEDSITARTLLKNILEASGYYVRTAVDGIDAFTALKAGEFDLVVSDIEMPRMDGFDLTAKIRADKKLSELPVVLVTALESREDREHGIDVGANAYIVKSSFDQSNLLEVIRRFI